MSWVGIFGPANMPPEVVQTLAREFEKMIAKPEVKEQFVTGGMDVYWIGLRQPSGLREVRAGQVDSADQGGRDRAGEGLPHGRQTFSQA